MVAARRLRKSYNGINNFNVLENKRDVEKKLKNKYSKIRNQDNNELKKINFKLIFIIKIFLCCLILFSIVLGKFIFKDFINNNQYIAKINNNYKLDYSKIDILESIEEKFKILDGITNGFIPNNLKIFFVDKYISKVKPFICNFDFKNEFNLLLKGNSNNVNIYNNSIDIYNNSVNIYENVNNNFNNEEKIDVVKNEFTGKGGVEIDNNISSISSNDENIIKLKETSFIVPVNGVITSRFGIRNQIFDNVNSYHTGIDIANALNTEIVSSIDGIVSNIVYEDLYYGNYIEISKEKVTTKYAHLNKVLININQEVKQGDVIGYMGTTGMSTGSHLHFEIWYNNNKVNPEEIITF